MVATTVGTQTTRSLPAIKYRVKLMEEEEDEGYDPAKETGL